MAVGRKGVLNRHVTTRQMYTNTGWQVTVANIFYGGAQYFWVLSMEIASCDPSGA